VDREDYRVHLQSEIHKLYKRAEEVASNLAREAELVRVCALSEDPVGLRLRLGAIQILHTEAVKIECRIEALRDLFYSI
jgi:hypothetical protein